MVVLSIGRPNLPAFKNISAINDYVEKLTKHTAVGGYKILVVCSLRIVELIGDKRWS